MNATRHFEHLRIAPVLLLLTFLSGGLRLAAAAERTTIDETRPASADGKVVIENVAGSVVVTGWDRAEVSIQGQVDEDARLEISGSGDVTRIIVEHPKGTRRLRHNHVSADLNVRAPFGSSLEVETVSANIRAEGISGGMNLESVSGGLEITVPNGKEDRGERLEVSSVSGTVEITGGSARVQASSVSGEVRLTLDAGEAEVSCVSGSVIIVGGRLEEIEASSVSGAVRFEGPFVEDGRYDFSSHSGSVKVVVPADASAQFSVSTFSGAIHSDFGERAERTSEYTPSKEMEFTVGSGKARVELSSFSGSVEILKR